MLHAFNQSNESFRVHKICSDLQPRKEWETAALEGAEEAELLHALQQSYRFLGKGAQCYAFASDDGQYVLKFIKHHHLRIPKPLDTIPLPGLLESWRQRKLKLKKRKLESSFASYLIAYRELKKETGLLYIHLNKSCETLPITTLIDPLGFKHKIKLDEMEFILQRKAEMLMPKLFDLAASERIGEAKNIIDQIIQLILTRHEKGIIDTDRAFAQNYGVLDGRVIEFDIGRFHHSPKLNKESCYEELVQSTSKLLIQLNNCYPTLGAHLAQRIAEQA